MKPGLSKSKILAYHQCPKRLWMEKRTPEVAETSDASERSRAGAPSALRPGACCRPAPWPRLRKISRARWQ